MEKRTINVYQFSELRPPAKQRAKDDYAEMWGYNWSSEAIESLLKLAEHFGGGITDYSVDWSGYHESYIVFDMPYMTPDDIGSKLDQLGSYDPVTLVGYGDCKLTGYCMDECAIDGFRHAFFNGELNLNALMNSAYDVWLSDCQDDYDAQYSDCVFSDMCDQNEWMFYKTGKSFVDDLSIYEPEEVPEETIERKKVRIKV